MQDTLNDWLAWLQAHTAFETVFACIVLLLAAWLTNFIVKRVIVRAVLRMARSLPLGDGVPLHQNRIVRRLANICPALVLILGARLVPGLPPAVVQILANVGGAFIILSVALALGQALDLLLGWYNRRPDAHLKPIKGYLQVTKIALYVLSTLLIIAVLVDRSPLILLSGLGAMAAVLLLIFQDTLLSLVASVQISSNDIVRVGDWIEMPGLNADGGVIDIALHTVKVQNWDKTITTIPTKRMISESFKNWRGMQQSGGRRIKRSLLLDQQSVHFLNEEEREHLRGFRLLRGYLREKLEEIEAWNATLEASGRTALNTRRITNIGTFRAYVECYLRSHSGVHQDMTLMARLLEPTADGLPLEIYCFTNTVLWAEYEKTQSDIFDHLLAIVPEFGLRVFQHPSGADLHDAVHALIPATGPARSNSFNHSTM